MKGLQIGLFILMLFFTISGCQDDTKKLMSVDVNFKLQYDGKPLVMFDKYIYPTGEDMLFSRFSFFLSSLQLEGVDNYLLKSIDYINFTNNNSTSAGATNGITLSFDNVDKVDYEKLSFKIGVNPAENAKVPSDFSSENPLSKAGEYWPNWNSYIFSRTEGQIKFDNEPLDFSLHTGRNNALLSVDLPVVDFDKADKRTIEVVIDLKDYFGKTKIYDIQANPQIHSPSQEAQVLELTSNMAECIKYDVK
jgi:hypothetical protein